MNYNDILRRLRFSLQLNDAVLLEVFSLGGMTISRERVEQLLAKEDADNYTECTVPEMNAFLQGFIIKRRGARDGEPAPTPSSKVVYNNDVLKALRIALALKDTDVIEIMANARITVTKSEISALFRAPEHPNYKKCGDQFLRNFIQGLNYKHRQVD